MWWYPFMEMGTTAGGSNLPTEGRGNGFGFEHHWLEMTLPLSSCGTPRISQDMLRLHYIIAGFVSWLWTRLKAPWEWWSGFIYPPESKPRCLHRTHTRNCLCNKVLPLGASRVALVVNHPPSNAGDARDMGSISGWGRSLGGGHVTLLQDSCLENPMDRGAWWATVHRVAKSGTQQKWLSMHAQTPFRKTFLELRYIQFTEDRIITEAVNLTFLGQFVHSLPWCHVELTVLLFHHLGCNTKNKLSFSECFPGYHWIKMFFMYILSFHLQMTPWVKYHPGFTG